MKRVYFDHNASTPVRSEVLNSIMKVYQTMLNPSSLHYHGRYTRNILENARHTIKKAFGLIKTHELIFTSGCTEANNLALSSFPEANKICSCIEHPAVSNLISNSSIPVNSNGIVDIDYIEDYLKNHCSVRRILLSIMYVNNQIGTIQPIQKIIQLTKKYNCIFHCDVTQAVGRIDIDVSDIDLITFSSHKFGGPIGSGALIYNKALKIEPMILGGGQEFGLRSGTQNTIAIYGMSKAFELISKIRKDFIRVKSLQSYLEKSLKKLGHNIIVFGERSTRIPNTSSISMPSTSAEVQLIFFDLNGISVSAGSACSSGKINSSNIYLAMGFSKKVANSSIRISLGPNNNLDEVNRFINLWKELYTKNN